jgi:hypothetical protein
MKGNAHTRHFSLSCNILKKHVITNSLFSEGTGNLVRPDECYPLPQFFQHPDFPHNLSLAIGSVLGMQPSQLVRNSYTATDNFSLDMVTFLHKKHLSWGRWGSKGNNYMNYTF